MEAWLGVGKDGTLWLTAGEVLLRLYAAASEKPAAAERLAAGPEALATSLVNLVKGPGIDVAAAWKLLVEEVGQPELVRFAPLLDKLEKHASPQLIAWPILKGDVTHDTKARGISFGLKAGAEAMLEFEAGGKAPSEIIAAGTPFPSGEKLVRVSAIGSVLGSATAKAPLNIGSIGFDASAEAKAKLSYFTHHPEDQFFAVALLDSLAHLRSPFVLSSAASFLTAFPKGIIQLDTAAGLKFAFNVALSAPFDIGLPGSASVAIAAKASVGGTYKVIVIRPDGAKPHVRLVLERVASSAQELGATIKLDLDLSAITARAKALLAQAKDLNAKTSGIIAKLDPYFTPGTLLKAQVKSLVQDLLGDETTKDLVLKALGFGAEGEPGDLLAKLIEDQVNALAAIWEDEQEVVVENLVSNITDAMDNPVFAEALDQELRPRLTKLLDGLKARLKDDLLKLATDNKVFDDLKSALNELGAVVQGTFEETDERAEALLGPVRKVLDKYQATVKGLLDQVDDYVNSALKAEITLLKSQTAARTLDLDITFDASHPHAEALYGRTFTDDLTSVFKAIRQAPAGAVKVQKTELTEYLERLSSSGVTVTFGKLALSFKKVLKSGVKFRIDQAGQIVEADLEQSLVDEAAYFHTRERVVFVSSQTLRAAHAQRATVALSVLRSARATTRERIDAFFRPVIDAGVLPESVAHSAKLHWFEWCSKANANAIPCQLSLVNALSDAELMKLLQLDRDANGIARATAPFDTLRVQQAAADALCTAMFGNQGAGAVTSLVAAKIRGRGVYLLFDGLRRRNVPVPGNDTAAGLLWAANLAVPLADEIKKYGVKLPTIALDQLERAQGAARMVHDFARAIEGMREIVVCAPVIGDKARPGEMTAATAVVLGKKIVENLSSWVMTDGPSFANLFGWSDKSDIDAATVGLMRVLHSLSGETHVKAAMELVDRETMKPLSPRMVAPLN